MRSSLRLGMPVAIVALTLAACGTTYGGPAATSAAPAPAESGDAVTIKGFAFKPATLSVAKGTAVTFTNDDTATHTVTSGSSGTKDGKFDERIDGGGATKITFDTPGTYQYFCSIHASMRGTIVVK